MYQKKGREGVDWIYMAENTARGGEVNTVINPVARKGEEFPQQLSDYKKNFTPWSQF
jgi:hypothetical protein